MSISKRYVDITGKKYGLLTAVRRTEEKSGSQYKWLFICECNNTVIRNPGNVRQSKEWASCGCTPSKKQSDYYSKPRRSLKREYKLTYDTWRGLRERCSNPRHASYKYYGDRGIKVCERWLGKSGFSNFLEDMGTRPSSEYSIDRIDNNGNYTKENCRWAVQREQARNKSSNEYIYDKGKKFLLLDFMGKYSIPISSFYKLLKIMSGDYQKTAEYILENRGKRGYIESARGVK